MVANKNDTNNGKYVVDIHFGAMTQNVNTNDNSGGTQFLTEHDPSPTGFIKSSTNALFDGIHHIHRYKSSVGLVSELIGNRSIHKHYIDSSPHLLPGKKYVLVATTTEVRVMYMSENYTKKQTDAFQSQLLQNERRYVNTIEHPMLFGKKIFTLNTPQQLFRYVGSFWGFCNRNMTDLTLEEHRSSQSMIRLRQDIIESEPYFYNLVTHPIVCFRVSVLVDGDIVTGVLCHDYRNIIIYPEQVESIAEQALMTVRRFTNPDIVRTVRGFLEICRR